MNLFFGIAQGSGFAPPTFQALSALMINSYKSLEHGVLYVSPVTGAMLILAAILCVNDTNLLFRADKPDSDVTEFVQSIHTAVEDWTRLVLATGGSLQPKSVTRV